MSDKKSQQINAIAYVCIRTVPQISQDFLSKQGLELRQVSCIGQVGAADVLNALSSEAERVVLIGCPDDKCRHEVGPKNARSQVQMVQEIINLLGFHKEQVVFLSADEAIERLKCNRQPPLSLKWKKAESAFRVPFSLSEVGFSPSNFVCIDCGRCSGICPVARTELGFSPRRLIKQALDNSQNVPVRALYACLGCDLCATVCPANKGFAQTVLKLRGIAFNNGASPVKAHSGIVQTIIRMISENRHKQRRLDWLKSELKVRDKGETALFIGCLPYFDVLFRELGVQPLKTAENALRIMNGLGVEPVVLLDERCCGHDLLWLGDIEPVRSLAEHNLKAFQEAGVKEVVFLCPECLRTFKLDYSAIVGETGLKLVHITEFLVRNGFKPGGSERKAIVTFQDPCRLGRHLGIYDEPRRLIKGLNGIELREMAHNQNQALCCGGASWLECGVAVKLLQERRLNEAKETGADTLVTACSKCEIHLSCALSRGEKRGLKIANIIDLLYEEK
ncbi:MAG: heterodisulfide reductase-related iron-sulfur binding cluster [candidate division WOR-3 bacterium]